MAGQLTPQQKAAIRKIKMLPGAKIPLQTRRALIGRGYAKRNELLVLVLTEAGERFLETGVQWHL